MAIEKESIVCKGKKTIKIDNYCQSQGEARQVRPEPILRADKKAFKAMTTSTRAEHPSALHSCHGHHGQQERGPQGFCGGGALFLARALRILV